MFVLRLCFSILLSLSPFLSIEAKTLSPYNYGLLKARTGVERYKVLMITHEEAIKRHCGVSYRGIKRIELEIPDKAKPIPLTMFNDFAGVEFTVRNNAKDCFLFEMSQPDSPIGLAINDFLSNDFRNNRVLRKGLHLLVIEDKVPWVNNRSGYNYGAQRKDIIVIKKGKALNETIYPYSDSLSKPSFRLCDISSKEKVIKNLVINRTSDSKKRTFVFSIINQYKVIISNVTINTPSTDFNGDKAISLINCARVKFVDIKINGTYSKKDSYGYGISMNNVWGSSFVRLNASGNWGIFGNNNINCSTIIDSDINRFDIHCYGRDITFKNTTFRNLYNQFSSLYGKLDFEQCRFIDFIPVLSESSYSAYTPFSVIIKNCSWTVSQRNRASLIRMGNSLARKDARPELTKVYWPEIHIDGLNIETGPDIKEILLFYVNGKDHSPVYGAETIILNKVIINSRTGNAIPDIRFSNEKMNIKTSSLLSVINSSVKAIKQ